MGSLIILLMEFPVNILRITTLAACIIGLLRRLSTILQFLTTRYHEVTTTTSTGISRRSRRRDSKMA